jgi:hypothetical protein
MREVVAQEVLGGVVDVPLLQAAMERARYGMSFLRAHGPLNAGQAKWHASAMEADLQLGYSALKEASRGTMLVLSALVGESLRALGDAGAEYSPVGSLVKKIPEEPARMLEVPTSKALAAPGGEKRTISDSRWLNEQVRKQAGQVFLETGLATPNAVCPRLAGVVRYIRLVHSEYQVGAQMVLMDFEGAYKLVLKALCGVVAQAAALPVGLKVNDNALRALGER